jgi:hypothetical protein
MVIEATGKKIKPTDLKVKILYVINDVDSNKDLNRALREVPKLFSIFPKLPLKVN